MTRVDYEIVTICGSMRWLEEMYKAAQFESRQGNIVLMPFVAFAQEVQTTDSDKLMLDQLHYDKIDLSSRILIVTNNNKYMGESTTQEFEYSFKNDKEISWWNVEQDRHWNMTNSRKGWDIGKDL